MSFIPVRNGKRNSEWTNILEEKLNEFLNNGDWLYDFGKENLQPKKQDIEARYLSQYFFCRLIENIDNRYRAEITDDTYMYLICNEKKTMFHFDIMNNPKEAHVFGKAIKNASENEWVTWQKRYHTIGNFAPVPWPILEYENKINGSINMQDIHKGFDERWDLFLKFCQSEWSNFTDYCVYIDFCSYMKLTCQEIYFTEIYDSFKNKFNDRRIKEVENEELLEWYDSVNSIELENKQIISFGKDLVSDVKKINQLIAIRGKLMMALALRNRKL